MFPLLLKNRGGGGGPSISKWLVIPEDVSGLTEGDEITASFTDSESGETITPYATAGPDWYEDYFLTTVFSYLDISPGSIDTPLVLGIRFRLTSAASNDNLYAITGLGTGYDIQIRAGAPNDYEIISRGLGWAVAEGMVLDEWYDLKVVFDGDSGETQFYVDGTNDGNGPYGSCPASIDETWSFFFDGYGRMRGGIIAADADLATAEAAVDDQLAEWQAEEVSATNSVKVQFPDLRNAAASVYRISNWGGSIADDIDVAFVTRTLDANPNPPSVTAGWGSDTNLFIAAAFALDDDATFSAYPSNYSNGQYIVAGGGANNSCEIGTAERQLTAASDNPGTFTLSELEGWMSATVVIEPDSGYPVVESRATQAFPNHKGYAYVDLPNTINSGDLVLVFLSMYSISKIGDAGPVDDGITLPAGWTKILNKQDDSNACLIAARVWP